MIQTAAKTRLAKEIKGGGATTHAITNVAAVTST